MGLPITGRLLCLGSLDEPVARRAYEWTLPQTPLQWGLALAATVLVLAFVLAVYWRDTRTLSPVWKVWLIVLRLATLITLLAIALDPQERTQKVAYRPSRAVLLVDRSLSMHLPAEVSNPQNSNGGAIQSTRAEAVRHLLTESGVVTTLADTHEVSVYTFDGKLTGPAHVFRSGENRGTAAASTDSAAEQSLPKTSPNHSVDSSAVLDETAPSDWTDTLTPQGEETRLGESLVELIRHVAGRTLSGIVVFTDGASNAGIDPSTANTAARGAKTRLIAVGVGSLEEPANLHIASIQAPTDVQVGDAFELSAFVQGQGFAQQSVHVDLLCKTADDSEPKAVETKDVFLPEDAVPTDVKFDLNPAVPGEVEYTVRVRADGSTTESNLTDNERIRTVNLVDRKLRVLLIAGGPSRDYRFVETMLHRHAAVATDVWLQTVEPNTAVSQDADRLLVSFPAAREEFYEYDVVVAFDADWQRVSREQAEMLRDWVFSQSGGLILCAGDVHTPRLAAGDRDELKPILELCPVVLMPYLLEYQLASESQQVWPIAFTESGREAEFLRIEEDGFNESNAWQSFPGVFRCYPTNGTKAGATVYAHHSDPRSQTEFGAPALIASQFYGSGQVLYLGTSELWRLRAMDEEYHDRLWMKLIRHVGQSRLQRGTNRGLLLLDRSEYALGQTITLRAQLLDPQFHPLDAPAVAMEVYTPEGKPLLPEPRLLPDKNRPGQFVGAFRASTPGTYRLELPIPQSKDILTRKLDVVIPNRETDDARQNAQLLRSLVQETGGTYLSLAEAESELPRWLPNRGEEFLIDDRLQSLWDRSWVLSLLVTLLSVEWLTRKLLKLA